MTAVNLYAALGLDSGASAEDIKKAYRKAALVNHPDRGGDKEAFQRVQIANEILSDPAKKAQYDATGTIPGAAEGGGKGMPDLSSLFGSIFSGGGMPMPMPMPFFGGATQGPRARAARGPNKIHEIGLSLVDLYVGKMFKLSMKRDVICSGCRGTGGAQVEACGPCRGTGMRMRGQQMGPIMTMMQSPCDSCSSTGTRVVKECADCHGRRTVERETGLDVKVEPGMQEGDRIVFQGQCSESPLFDVPGDVVLVIRVASTDPPAWVRRGPDLVVELQLSLAESLLGWTRDFGPGAMEHPSRKPLALAWLEGVIREGEVLRVPGWGMPIHGKAGQYGDLRLVCRVATVDQGAWSEEQLRALKSVWPEWEEVSVDDGRQIPTRT